MRAWRVYMAHMTHTSKQAHAHSHDDVVDDRGAYTKPQPAAPSPLTHTVTHSSNASLAKIPTPTTVEACSPSLFSLATSPRLLSPPPSLLSPRAEYVGDTGSSGNDNTVGTTGIATTGNSTGSSTGASNKRKNKFNNRLSSWLGLSSPTSAVAPQLEFSPPPPPPSPPSSFQHSPNSSPLPQPNIVTNSRPRRGGATTSAPPLNSSTSSCSVPSESSSVSSSGAPSASCSDGLPAYKRKRTNSSAARNSRTTRSSQSERVAVRKSTRSKRQQQQLQQQQQQQEEYDFVEAEEGDDDDDESYTPRRTSSRSKKGKSSKQAKQAAANKAANNNNNKQKKKGPKRRSNKKGSVQPNTDSELGTSGVGTEKSVMSAAIKSATSETDASVLTPTGGISAFLLKLYDMVNHPQCQQYIQWTGEGLTGPGESFLVTNSEKLAAEILPLFFKHSNFSSFVRQLNMYGFHKLGTPKHWEFYHEHFQRGKPGLLRYIKRKVSAADSRRKSKSRSAAAASDSKLADRVDELSNQVESMKSSQSAMIKYIEELQNQLTQTQNALAQLTKVVCINNGLGDEDAEMAELNSLGVQGTPQLTLTVPSPSVSPNPGSISPYGSDSMSSPGVSPTPANFASSLPHLISDRAVNARRGHSTNSLPPVWQGSAPMSAPSGGSYGIQYQSAPTMGRRLSAAKSESSLLLDSASQTSVQQHYAAGSNLYLSPHSPSSSEAGSPRLAGSPTFSGTGLSSPVGSTPGFAPGGFPMAMSRRRSAPDLSSTAAAGGGGGGGGGASGYVGMPAMQINTGQPMITTTTTTTSSAATSPTAAVAAATSNLSLSASDYTAAAAAAAAGWQMNESVTLNQSAPLLGVSAETDVSSFLTDFGGSGASSGGQDANMYGGHA